MDYQVGSTALRQQCDSRWGQLEQDASSWIGHWRDLCDFVLPRMARFLVQDRNKGYRANQRILNERATVSLRSTSRGMMSKITNPARPWIKLQTTNNDLNQQQDVKVWLDAVTNRVLQIFIRSNLYTQLAMVYQDILLYGTAAFVVEMDPETVIRIEVLPIGSYRLALGGSNRVDTCYRTLEMTRHQLVDKFGIENVSDTIRVAVQKGDGFNLPVQVRHCVEPNDQYVPGAMLNSHFKFRSVWYEIGAGQTKFLRQSGFNSMAVIAPRWETCEGDTYGASPAMDALGSIKELQLLEKRYMQLLDKVISPALNVPVELRRREINQFSGGLNFVSNPGQAKIEPIHQINTAPLQEVQEKIASVEQRIRECLFEDVFMAMNGIDSARTAEEIRARLDQKIQSIGPILLKLNDEMLDPLVERTFELMQDPFFKGLMPPAPEVVQGAPITVEYISDLAQALKLAGLSSIERVIGFAGNIASMGMNQVFDKINVDKTMDIYLDMAGAPAQMGNDDKTVGVIRNQRAQAQQQQQAQVQQQQQAEVLNKLGNTPTVGGNALTDMSQAIQ
jgi:Bacteriophage head to tail connecting protein